MFEKIQLERQQERCHLQLCNDIYLHQVGLNRHFHLEQPHGSEMIDQPDLSDTKMGTLQATFDMCQVGKLRLPNTSKRRHVCIPQAAVCLKGCIKGFVKGNMHMTT